MAKRKGRYGDGTIYKRNGSPFWWVKFHHDGKPVYESTKTKDEAEARRYLQKRLGELATGQFHGRAAERLTVADLCQLVLDDYASNGYRSRPDAKRRIEGHIVPLLGKVRAVRFGSRDVRGYVAARRREGAANATINHELNLVRKGFNLAHRADPPLVHRLPYIERLKEDNVRRGFLEHGDYLKLRQHLPFHLQVFLVLAYNTGTRRSELLGDNRKERRREPLRWEQVDFEAQRIYLPKTKNGSARTVPFIGDMEQWLRAAWDDHKHNWPECPYVIHKGGRPVFDPRKTWSRACEAAGLPDLWRHDLRRSAVRNLDRSGVSQKVAMAISGHKTRSVFDRYNIVSDRDLGEAARKVGEFFDARRKGGEEGEAPGRVN